MIQISPHSKEISFKDEAIYSASLSSCLGQTVYGRVSWNPEQDLQSAYKLSIQKVYLCAGIFIKLKSCYRFYWKKIDDVFTVEKNPLFSRKEWLYSKLWPWGRYIWGRKAVWMCPTKSWTPVSLPYPSMYHWLRPKIYSYREWSE